LYNIYRYRKQDLTLSAPVRSEMPERRWLSLRGLLASLVIVCLTVTLANRTVHITAYDKVTVNSFPQSQKSSIETKIL